MGIELKRCCHGYESISLEMSPDYENNRTLYTVTDRRRGKYNHIVKDDFDKYVYDVPCGANEKYEKLCAEFEAENEGKHPLFKVGDRIKVTEGLRVVFGKKIGKCDVLSVTKVEKSPFGGFKYEIRRTNGVRSFEATELTLQNCKVEIA